VPLGTFSAKQEQTVLMKLRVPADAAGTTEVADVKLTYTDLVRREPGSCDGNLALVVTADPNAAQKDMDPIVATRFERSRTAQTLTQVNDLFAQGQVSAALGLLQQQKDNLDKAAALARRSPRPPRAVARDLATQQSAVSRAAVQPSAAPTSRVGKERSKQNEWDSFDFRK
jgi:Ca-activated chloride channel family protein